MARYSAAVFMEIAPNSDFGVHCVSNLRPPKGYQQRRGAMEQKRGAAETFAPSLRQAPHVQGFTVDCGTPAPTDQVYEAVTCTAFRRLHLVNAANGHVGRADAKLGR